MDPASSSQTGLIIKIPRRKVTFLELNYEMSSEKNRTRHCHPRETDGPSVKKTSHNLITSTNNVPEDRMTLSQGVVGSGSTGKGESATETDRALLSSVLCVFSEHPDSLPGTQQPDPAHLTAPKAAKVPNSPQVILRSVELDLGTSWQDF